MWFKKRRTINKIVDIKGKSNLTITLSCEHIIEDRLSKNKDGQYQKTMRCSICENPHTYYRTSY